MGAPVISNGNPKFSSSNPVVLASAMAFGANGGAPVNVTQSTPLPVRTAGVEYETTAASQTASPMGAAGVIGDYIEGLLVIPATTSPGAVTLLDGAVSMVVFAGGATSVADLKPFYIKLGLISTQAGGWKITTGAAVSVIAGGDFT